MVSLVLFTFSDQDNAIGIGATITIKFKLPRNTSMQTPKHLKGTLFPATIALLLFAGSSHAALTLVGTYDPGSDSNDADQSATFNPG